MARVTGIGGVFFRVADPSATAGWYRDHLGLQTASDHPFAVVPWSGGETTVWAPFPDDTAYLGDRGQQLMVNYRVDDLDEMLERLRADGVDVIDEIVEEENGRFGWAIDGDGRRFELWQPAPGH